MLPYSLKKGDLSFTDKKWNWRYQINKDGSVEDKYPTLNELMPSGIIKEYKCQIEKT